MPCYVVNPTVRRNVHYNPYFAPQAVSIVPRFAAPFFRGLEEDLAQFENFFKEIDQRVSEKKSFQPRFDIKEESDRFVLNGELPGVQPENLQIEFTDRNTMVVKGKVVRQESHGTPPKDVQQTEEKVQEESQDVSMSGAASDTVSEQTSNYHKASVEDEGFESSEATSKTPTEQQVTKSTTQEVEKPVEQPQSHYWVNERTVGEFSRAFRFPGKVNQDEVKATLRDGILTVAVPKLVEQDHRRKIEVHGE